MKKKFLALVLTLAMVLSLVPVTALAEETAPVAQIGEKTYSSINTAIEQAEEAATIELLQDVKPTKTFSKSLTFTGGHAINFNVYGWRYKGDLVLDGARLNIINDASSQPANNDEAGRWCAMCLTGSITAKNQAEISFVIDSDSGATCAIYMDEHAQERINVESGSRFSITGENTNGTVGDGIQLGNTENTGIYVSENSKFLIDGTNRGYVNSPTIKVENSTFTVRNCTSNASNGGKFEAINSDVNFIDNAGHGLSATTLTSEKSNFTCSGNAYYGITVAGDLSVDGESNITANENGTGFTGGGLRLGTSKTNGTIFKGATLTLDENFRNALENYGNLTIQSGVVTEILKNNEPDKSGGGGIYNGGTLTLPSDAKIYNNHAKNAGDDIYSTGKITFGDVGKGWVLDDCDHAITGWYDDGENARWCADTLPRHLKEYAPRPEETRKLALKAAHGVDPVPLPEPKLETPEIDKTATPLNQDKSTVTLTVGGSEEKANIAVMFLLDKSTSQTEARQNAAEMLWNLKEKTNTNIIYDVVIFSGTATSTGWRNIADDETRQDSINNFANRGPTSGTNMTAGIDQAKKDMKTLSEYYPEYKDSTFLVTISDGVSYYWDENGVTKCVPIAAWNGNETVFETTPKSDVSTWEMMYSAGTSLEDVYGGVSQFLAIIPDKMQATREKGYVRNYEGDSTDLENPLTTYVYNPTKKQRVADTYASAAEFSMYYSIQGYADLVKSFARVYTLPMPEVNTDGSEKETWTKYYPWGREVMLYLQNYSTNAGAGIFHDANSEEIFQEIKDEILYSIQRGVVTDIIGKNFDLTDRNKLTENTFTLKVGGAALKATVDTSNDKVVYFGAADENGKYPYEVKYQPASTDTKEQLIWIINEPVERSKRLTLSYSLDLINKKTASGTYTEPTNENAVLDYVTTTNEEGRLTFPVPTVSYTVSGGGGGGGGGTVTIPDDVPTGLDLKNHYGYIIGYPVDYYTGKPTTDQTKKPVRPEGKITRAEVATIYFRMLTDENRAANWNQVSGFSDVKRSAWYNNAVSTLTKAGILKGYEDGTFQPDGYITRAEFATIAIRFFSGVYEGEDLFPDIKGHWAQDYINNAANKGLVKGYEDGTFGPDRYITRAEAVTLVNRTLNRHPHNDGLHQDMLRWPDNMDTSKWYYADMQEATNSHEPDKNKSTADKEYWGKMLPIRDWEALEKEWSNANSAPGEGEVV